MPLGRLGPAGEKLFRAEQERVVRSSLLLVAVDDDSFIDGTWHLVFAYSR